MPDVNTPLGAVPKPMVIIAVIAGGGALVYSYVKKKNAAKTATAQDTSQNPPVDSSSQYGYGAYGYGAYTYEPYGYGYGPFGLGSYGSGGGGNYGYGYFGAGVPAPVPQQASTNAQWVQAAESALTAVGFSGADVLTALGLYTRGQPVTSAQASIVNAAIGAEGYPPVSGANGFPPAINTGGSPSGGTNPGGGTVTVPNVVGANFGHAYNVIVYEHGLKISPNHINSSYIITSQSPAAGTKVNAGSTVTVKYKK